MATATTKIRFTPEVSEASGPSESRAWARGLSCLWAWATMSRAPRPAESSSSLHGGSPSPHALLTVFHEAASPAS